MSPDFFTQLPSAPQSKRHHERTCARAALSPVTAAARRTQCPPLAHKAHCVTRASHCAHSCAPSQHVATHSIRCCAGDPKQPLFITISSRNRLRVPPVANTPHSVFQQNTWHASSKPPRSWSPSPAAKPQPQFPCLHACPNRPARMRLFHVPCLLPPLALPTPTAVTP